MSKPEYTDEDMANVGRALMDALPEGYVYNNCPSEIVADLQNKIADLRMGPALSGLALRLHIPMEKAVCESKAEFEEYIRTLSRPDVGDDANDLTETDFVLDLAEPGWPDSGKWNPNHNDPGSR